MITWKRFTLAIGAIILLALTFITFILPGMVVERASRWVSEETGRKLAIEDISINPFGLTVEINKLKLSDVDHSKSFVSWELLRVSLSAASLWHMSPVVDELTLDSPGIHLERLSESSFNFSDLIPAKEEPVAPDEPTSEPFRFSVNNIHINNGRVDLIDNSLKEQIHHKITDLQLVLPSIGNLPYMVEDPAQPLFKAVINDSPIDIQGRIKPFTSNQEMQFKFELQNKDIPFYLGYIPTELPVEVRNGKFNLDLDILYRFSEKVGTELILSGKASITSLNIWDKLQKQLFFLPLLQVELAPSQPLKQDVHLSALRVYNLEVQLDRDQSGEWNHARMAQSKPEQPEAQQQEETAEPFKLVIDKIDIHDGVVFFSDELPAGGFQSVAKEINLSVKDFALDAQSDIPFTLSLQTELDEKVSANGDFFLQPFSLNLQAELSALKLGAYRPYYQDFYSQPLGGELSLRADLHVSPENPFLVSNGNLTLDKFSAAFNEREGIDMSLFAIHGLSYDLGKNRLEIDSVASDATRINFSRDDAGSWSFMSQNFPVLTTGESTEQDNDQPPAQGKDNQSSPFSYHIGQVDINDWQVDFTDDQPKEKAEIHVEALSLSVSNLAAPEKVNSPFQLGMTLQKKGRIEIKGATALSDFETSATTQLKRIPLATLAPYVAEHSNLILTDGFLNARINTIVTTAGDEFKIGYSGDIGINRMHLLDRAHEEDLLKWDSLQVAGITGEVSPFSLSVDSVTLSDYFAKILIDEEARLNLTEAFRKGGEEETETQEEAIEEPEVAEKEVSEAPNIRISKVTLQGGRVDFTDQSLPRPFHADMQELGGRIDGLSSSAESRAEVDLRGNLRNQSPLNITGTINPLAEDIFLDLELSFRDIEMSPFSPYSGNFVGYMIEKGKLNLALEYAIENHQLKATNKVFLDQFSFGAAVESENATSLPVKLAVALLKDGNGEIHLDIPVYGSLDDPQFSIGGVVWTVIKNLLVKAATSPFALLGALIGGGEEDFSSVSFDYGSKRLSTAEQDKLKRMAQALLERPSLEIEISGYIDPEKDPEGYRKEQLSLKIKRLAYLDLIKKESLPEGTTEEDVTVPAEEYPEYLWQVYKKEDFPKPRNFIGMTKELPEDEMEKLIYANTIVSDDQLAQLAQERALAVQNFLAEEGQLPPERIFLKKPEITEPPEQETANRARVELDATVK